MVRARRNYGVVRMKKDKGEYWIAIFFSFTYGVAFGLYLASWLLPSKIIYIN